MSDQGFNGQFWLNIIINKNDWFPAVEIGNASLSKDEKIKEIR